MRITRSRLRPHNLDGKSRHRAKDLADQWRAIGLTVDLVEYLGTAKEPGGYTVTAHSGTSVMSCRCQSWLARTWLWRRRPLWTITVTVRPATPDSIAAQPGQVVVAAAWEHERAWDKVQAWIDQAHDLPKTFEAALASVD